MSRNHLISALLLSLLTACSSVKMGNIGPHRIDVQQGNALDQESVSKLKPGLNRSQVRFLLGTPLLVDPFRNNRWDYVYTFHKGGKLAEQKRITLFFDDEILQRIEGDVPVSASAVAEPSATSQPLGASSTSAAPASVESLPLDSVKKPESVVDSVEARYTNQAPTVAKSAPVAVAPVAVAPVVVATSPIPESKALTPRTSAAPQSQSSPVPQSNMAQQSSVVQPLASPQASPAYVAPPSTPNLQLHPETNVAQIQPDVIPVFPEPNTPPAAAAATTEASALLALKAWSDAWAKGNADAYIGAYAADFLPPGGDTHANWEKRRRMLLGVAKNVELRIESPKVKIASDGHALVTFNQYYKSQNYNDTLVKQIKLAQRNGRWLIVDEHVVSILQPPKP